MLVMLAAPLAGCPRVDPPLPDSGPPPMLMDSGPMMRVDTDGDGLCDGTEIATGTDPLDADSDGDGVSDRAERDLGFSPLAPDSPERDRLVFMQEGPDSSMQFPIERIVRGRGETYSGAFQALPVSNRLDYTASTFLERARAIGANPMENVFEVLPEEQRFVGVFGRTQLTFELRFAFAGATPRECVTAFPFQHQVKRDDGRTVAFGRYLLVVLPDGTRLENADWCVPEGDCI